MTKDYIKFTIPKGTSLKSLKEKNKDLFYAGNDWYEDEVLFQEETTQSRTICLLTEAKKNSFNKTFAEQKKLLGKREYVPTALEVVYGMIEYYRKMGQRLFSNCWVRCQDVSSHGFRVDVRLVSDGVDVNYGWDDIRFSSIGLAVARKSLETSESLRGGVRMKGVKYIVRFNDPEYRECKTLKAATKLIEELVDSGETEIYLISAGKVEKVITKGFQLKEL